MKILVSIILKVISTSLKILQDSLLLVCCSVLSVTIFFSLSKPTIPLLVGEDLVVYKENHQVIHELFPRSNWDDLIPCGARFNEQEEYNKALQCVNDKVFPDNKIKETTIPRCFILKAKAPDVYFQDSEGFNFIPIVSPLGIGAVVGVYQPETKTVFLVENIDAKLIYRHELQHYFLDIHVEGSDGGGHYQEIWRQCEPPYYDPSEEVKRKIKKPVKIQSEKEKSK